MFNGKLKVWRDGAIIHGRLTVETQNRGPVTVDVSSPVRKRYAQVNGVRAAASLTVYKVKNDLVEAAKYWPTTSLVHPTLVAYSNRLFTDLNSTSSKASGNARAKVERLRELVEQGSGSAADILYCLKRNAERELARRRGMRMMMGYTPIVVGYDFNNAFAVLRNEIQKLDAFAKKHGPQTLAKSDPIAFGVWLYAKRRAQGGKEFATFQKAVLPKIVRYAQQRGPSDLKAKHPASYGMLAIATKLSGIAREQRKQTAMGGPIILTAGPQTWNRIGGRCMVGSIFTWAEKAVKAVTNSVACQAIAAVATGGMSLVAQAAYGAATGQKDAVTGLVNQIAKDPGSVAKALPGVLLLESGGIGLGLGALDSLGLKKAGEIREAALKNPLAASQVVGGAALMAVGQPEGAALVASGIATLTKVPPDTAAKIVAAGKLAAGGVPDIKDAAAAASMIQDGIDTIRNAKAGDPKSIADIKTVKALAGAGVPGAQQVLSVLRNSQDLMNKTAEAAEKEIGTVPMKPKIKQWGGGLLRVKELA
ncbi:MAG: hypothetical protein V1784_07120 [bacterium]